MGNGNSSSGNESDPGQSAQEQRQQGGDAERGCGKASGQGAASAYARLHSQMEERAQHTPTGAQGGRA